MVTRRRTARGKLRALVAALNVLSEELGGAPAAEELLAALSDTLAAAQIATPHAEAAFVHAFCRDRSLLLGVEGYALTSLEVALATPPRPDDGAGAPDSSRGLVITLVSYPDGYEPITTSPAPARTPRAPWRVWAP